MPFNQNIYAFAASFAGKKGGTHCVLEKSGPAWYHAHLALVMLRTRKILVLNAIQHDSHNRCIHKGSPVLAQMPFDGVQLQSEPAMLSSACYEVSSEKQRVLPLISLISLHATFTYASLCV